MSVKTDPKYLGVGTRGRLLFYEFAVFFVTISYYVSVKADPKCLGVGTRGRLLCYESAVFMSAS